MLPSSLRATAHGIASSRCWAVYQLRISKEFNQIYPLKHASSSPPTPPPPPPPLELPERQRNVDVQGGTATKSKSTR